MIIDHNNHGLNAYLSDAYADTFCQCNTCLATYPADQAPMNDQGEPECCGEEMKARPVPEPVPLWKRHRMSDWGI